MNAITKNLLRKNNITMDIDLQKVLKKASFEVESVRFVKTDKTRYLILQKKHFLFIEKLLIFDKFLNKVK